MKPPDVAGFPIDGDVNVKLVSGGVQVPVSLKLPGAFGGITGSATLSATLNGGLNLDSLEFKVGDVSFGALELKDIDISYTRDGEVWKGGGTVNVPTGGKLFSLSVAIEFDHGDYKSGSFEVGLPYPGVPMDLNDTPPQLYLARGGLGLGLGPPSLSGSVRFGITPLYTQVGSTPGTDGSRDYAFTLDGGLTASFGDPVKLTVTADGYLYSVKIADAKLVYSLPDTVALTGKSSYDLGVVEEQGTLQALVDPHSHTFGGRIAGSIVLHVAKLGLSSALPSSVLDGGDITLPSQAFAINTTGFGVYIPPTPGIPFIGTITYDWGDDAPVPHPFVDVTSDYANGLPSAASAHARAAAEGFDVPAGAPAVALDVTGDGGAPAIVLTAPDGSRIEPTAPASGATAVALGDPGTKTTHVGVSHPAAGRWTVTQAPGSAIAVTGLRYVVGEAAPKVTARVSGRGARRTLSYRVSAPKNVTVAFAEQTGSLFHALGSAKGSSGSLRFTPANGPAGKRSIVALIDNGGLPHGRPVVATYVASRPARPGRATRLRVSAGAKAFAVKFGPPRGAVRTIVRVVATDGRRLQKVLPRGRGALSIPVIGYRDGVTVSVTGISAEGRKGPACRPAPAARRSRPRTSSADEARTELRPHEGVRLGREVRRLPAQAADAHHVRAADGDLAAGGGREEDPVRAALDHRLHVVEGPLNLELDPVQQQQTAVIAHDRWKVPPRRGWWTGVAGAVISLQTGGKDERTLGGAERSIRPPIELVFGSWTRTSGTGLAERCHARHRWRPSRGLAQDISASARSPRRSTGSPGTVDSLALSGSSLRTTADRTDGRRLARQARRAGDLRLTHGENARSSARQGRDSVMRALPVGVGRARWRRRGEADAGARRLGGACSRCGYSKAIEALHFHHVDPATKRFALGRAMSSSMRVPARRGREMRPAVRELPRGGGERSSGGGIRTHNHSINSRVLCR